MTELTLDFYSDVKTPAHYQNTVNLTGEKLKHQERKAAGLATAIHNFFKRHPYEMFTAESIHKLIMLPVREGSVRARLSELVKDKKLIRLTNEKTMGSFGHHCTYYKLIND